jgi:DedD protein
LALALSAPIVDGLVKERLTGAIILVALIVLLVPELLSGPIRARARGPASPAEEPPLRSYTINLADDAHGNGAVPQPAAGASPATPAAEPAAMAAPLPAPAERPPPAAASPAPAAAPGLPTPATQPAAANAGSAGWMVQIGSFANRANAERLAQELRGQGFRVGVSRGSGGRRLYRVQVGPAHDRSAAEQLAAKLRADGHKGAIVSN